MSDIVLPRLLALTCKKVWLCTTTWSAWKHRDTFSSTFLEHLLRMLLTITTPFQRRQQSISWPQAWSFGIICNQQASDLTAVLNTKDTRRGIVAPWHKLWESPAWPPPWTSPDLTAFWNPVMLCSACYTLKTDLNASGCMRSRIWRVFDPGAAHNLQHPNGATGRKWWLT